MSPAKRKKRKKRGPNGRGGNKNGMNWIRPEKRLAIYLRDNFMCVYCEINLHNAEEGQCSLDHLVPRSEGGTHNPDNLVTSCLACNIDRGHMPWELYASDRACDRIAYLIKQPINLNLAKEILKS